MAEYIFRHHIDGRDGWTSKSAGTFATHGSPASQHAREALREWNLDLSPHQSQPLSQELMDESGLIAVMTRQHQHEVVRQFPDTVDRVRQLTSFGISGEAPDVSDPIGMSLHVYRHVRDQIDSAIADLILDLIGS